MSLVSGGKKKKSPARPKYGWMSFFNLLLVNNDLWGSRGGEGKGKALPWSCLVAAGLVQGLAPPKPTMNPGHFGLASPLSWTMYLMRKSRAASGLLGKAPFLSSPKVCLRGRAGILSKSWRGGKILIKVRISVGNREFPAGSSGGFAALIKTSQTFVTAAVCP